MENNSMTSFNKKSKTDISLSNKLLGISFGIILFISSFLGVVFFHACLFAFMFTKCQLHRKLVDDLIGSWLVFCAVGGV